MIKKAFFGFSNPKLEYTILDETVEKPVSIKPSNNIIYHLKENQTGQTEIQLEVGDLVKNGQKLTAHENTVDFCLCCGSGQIVNISDFKGLYEEKFTSITIEVDNGKTIFDEHFLKACRQPTLENALTFYAGLPGKPDFTVFSDPDKPVQTIIVLGIDEDLLCTTNQYFVRNHIEELKNGIDLLGRITGISDIVLAVPPHLEEAAVPSLTTVKTVDTEYPHANRALLRHSISSPGADSQHPDDTTICFFSAESVCSIASVNASESPALNKIVSFVSKAGQCCLVSVPMGTAVQDILNHFNETLEEGDRLILGGPMTGTAVYSADIPVLQNTDIIMVQSRHDIITNEDRACINCGACVRVCPANIQINHLIRLLEARQYEEAAEHYDLFSCIDCGYCSYVCEARIAVYQQITLAKQILEGTESYKLHA